MINLLLTVDDEKRLALSLGDPDLAASITSFCKPPSSDPNSLQQQTPLPALLTQISYDTLRQHEILDHLRGRRTGSKEEGAVEEDRNGYYPYTVAVRVPLLHDLCIRATGRACLEIARIVCEHGGAVPPSAPWIKVQ